MRSDITQTRPTMKDVAAKAGVSRALVSMVFRGSPNVSEKRRKAVEEAAKDLGFRPNAAASRLASRSSKLIAVLISDLKNPFVAEVVGGARKAADEEGFQLVFTTADRDAEGEERAVEGLLSFLPAGLLLLSPVLPDPAVIAVSQSVPCVVVSRDSLLPGIDTINDDGRSGVGLAVEHLARLGHRRIVYLDGGMGGEAGSRRRGYQEAMLGRGLSPIVIPSEYTEAAGGESVERLLNSETEFTALIAANDINAVGAVTTLKAHGFAVPDDVSVVGYDNSSIAALEQLSLTTIDQQGARMGGLAVMTLLEQVRKERTEPLKQLLHPTLVIRSSTAAPPAEKRVHSRGTQTRRATHTK